MPEKGPRISTSRTEADEAPTTYSAIQQHIVEHFIKTGAISLTEEGLVFNEHKRWFVNGPKGPRGDFTLAAAFGAEAQEEQEKLSGLCALGRVFLTDDPKWIKDRAGVLANKKDPILIFIQTGKFKEDEALKDLDIRYAVGKKEFEQIMQEAEDPMRRLVVKEYEELARAFCSANGHRDPDCFLAVDDQFGALEETYRRLSGIPAVLSADAKFPPSVRILLPKIKDGSQTRGYLDNLAERGIRIHDVFIGKVFREQSEPIREAGYEVVVLGEPENGKSKEVSTRESQTTLIDAASYREK
ncbi:hypothetical protein KKG52_01810 [Patescibacteria group bacterium]|nr:hypothetical protein [Patescibacteria group bacterium]